MARVAIVAPNPPATSGGVERFCWLLERALTAAGHEVELFARPEGWRSGRAAARLGLSEVALARDVQAALLPRAAEFDAVVTNGLFGYRLHHPGQVAVFHGVYRASARSVYREYNPRERFVRERLLPPWERRSAAGAAAVVADSYRVADEMATLYGVPGVRVIENGVDLERFRAARDGERAEARAAFGLPAEGMVALFVGRPEYGKGATDILPWVAAKTAGWLTVAAAGAEAGQLPGVLGLGDVDDERFAELYRACDCLLFPSRYEGGAYAVLEALASGLPVVASDRGSASMSLRDPRLAEFTVTTDDWGLYEHLLRRLRDEPETARELGAVGRAYAERYHALDAWERAIVGVVEEAAARGRGGPR
jgi:glycosyltransferase involved in cell wall biosynthesis